MTEIVFTRTDGRVGQLTLRPVSPVGDAPMLHAWLMQPKSAYWLMQDATLGDVEREQRDIARSPSRKAFVGLRDDTPTFLVETYDPARSELVAVYTPQPGDVGMHFLVAPTDAPTHGFTDAVMVTIMELLFAEAATHRVVVEPDADNAAVQARNAAVGFEVVDRVRLSDKEALLSTCTRRQYRAARPEQPHRDEAPR